MAIYDIRFPMVNHAADAMASIQRAQQAAQEAQYRRDNPAEFAFRALVNEVRSFEAQLSNEHEVGLRLVNCPHEGVFHVESMKARNPDLIVFTGVNADGLPIKLVQHVSQLSFALSALPKLQDQPRRIGF